MVRIFRRLDNKSRSVYAVTGTTDPEEAVMEVIKFKKASAKTAGNYICTDGVIADYTDENGNKMDDLYLDDKMKGKKVLIVCR